MCVLCELEKLEKVAPFLGLPPLSARPCRSTSKAGYSTGIGPALTNGLTNQKAQGDTVKTETNATCATQATPAPKPETTAKNPTTIFSSAKLETPQREVVAIRNLGLGQALVLKSGNLVYRLGPELYLHVGQFNLTVHYSLDTLPALEGHLAPFGSTLVIKL